MRFMIIVRADKNTEAGVMPSESALRRLGTKLSAGRRAFSWRAIRQTKLQLPTIY